MVLCTIAGILSGCALIIGRRRLPENGKKAVFILFLVSLMGLAAGVSHTCTLADVTKIRRQPPGDGEYQKELRLHADGILEDTDYIVHVPEQIFTADEEHMYLRAAQEEISQTFTGQNDSVNEIRMKVEAKSSYQNGAVSAEWLFSPCDVIDSKGNITLQEIPEEGISVQADVSLSCGESKCDYLFYFQVFPQILDEQQQFLQTLEAVLKKASQEPGQEYLSLPNKIGQYHVLWSEKEDYLPEKILLFGIVAAALVPVAEQSRLRERQKERQKQLQLEYPDLLSKLALLIGAGMTLKMAWTRIAISYQNKRQNEGGKHRPVYEEMLFAMRRMENGLGEEHAYLQFGERCGLQKYRRFSGLLAQNLRKGNREIMQLLLSESDHAFEERKALARKYGEEAATKLLFPMILLLGVVMAILLVPALLSF